MFSHLFGSDPNSTTGATLQFMLPMVLIYLVFYFLMIRPSRQQQQRQKNALATIKRGDRVVTAGGVLATVQKVRDTELDLDIAPTVRITVLRDTISQVQKPASDAGNDNKAA